MKKYSKFIICIVFVLSTVLTVAIAIGIVNDADDGLMIKPSQAVYLGQIFLQRELLSFDSQKVLIKRTRR